MREVGTIFSLGKQINLVLSSLLALKWSEKLQQSDSSKQQLQQQHVGEYLKGCLIVLLQQESSEANLFYVAACSPQASRYNLNKSKPHLHKSPFSRIKYSMELFSLAC